MRQDERSIGEVFLCKGKTYKVVEGDPHCEGCDLKKLCSNPIVYDTIGKCRGLTRTDRKCVIFKEIKSMETIEINGKSYLIDIEKATEQGLLKEKDNKPRSWEEYWEMYKAKIKQGKIQGYDNYAPNHRGNDDAIYDVFNSVDEAKAFCALGKLIQLRDAWCDDWRPNWDNGENKYCIHSFKSEPGVLDACYRQRILTFPTEEMATDFLETFRDLIEQAKIFL